MKKRKVLSIFICMVLCLLSLGGDFGFPKENATGEISPDNTSEILPDNTSEIVSENSGDSSKENAKKSGLIAGLYEGKNGSGTDSHEDGVAEANLTVVNNENLTEDINRGTDATVENSYLADDEIKIEPKTVKGASPFVNAANTIPASYSSVPKGYITSVKTQGYSDCWSFATIGASEASLIKNNGAPSNLDLSEWHLSYFTNHAVTDPLGGTEGDSFSIEYENASDPTGYLRIGGNAQIASIRMANWVGPADESLAPYSDVALDPTSELDSNLCYQSRYHLRDAYWIPVSETTRNYIKNYIMKYGACAASYCDNDAYYNDDKTAEYCGVSNVKSNHAITIVGWDDDYDLDNFKEGHKPSSNGAWLVKNSRGEGQNDNGYLWISYEDKVLNGRNAYFFNFASADNYKHNYQYDGGASTGSAMLLLKGQANVFTAKSPQTLKAVGYYTGEMNVDVTISVYTDCKKDSNGNVLPASGKLVYTSYTKREPFPGYHTFDLAKNIELKENQTFSVVVKNVVDEDASGNGRSAKCVIDANYTEDLNEAGTQKLVNRSAYNRGESFVLYDESGAWKDMCDTPAGAQYKDSNGVTKHIDMPKGSLRVKAFTDDRSLDSYDTQKDPEESGGNGQNQNTTETNTGNSTPSVPDKHKESSFVDDVAGLPVGTTFIDVASNAYYTVTKSGQNASGTVAGAEVTYIKPVSRKAIAVIPNVVTKDGVTYSVTAIGNYAFLFDNKLMLVNIGSRVRTIGPAAFYGCRYLRRVNIGAEVSYIGAYAFGNCPSLMWFIIPPKTSYIGPRAFWGCSGMRIVLVLSQGLNYRNVGIQAFTGIYRYAYFKVPRKLYAGYYRLFYSRGLSKTNRMYY